jgi:hypothetical protein
MNNDVGLLCFGAVLAAVICLPVFGCAPLVIVIALVLVAGMLTLGLSS